MELIDFPERTAIIAEHQPEYRDLPAHQLIDDHGTIVCCWRLTFWERLRLLFTGCIWHRVLTFYDPLQPQLLTIEKPFMAKCRKCGCMNAKPCEQPDGEICSWIERDLCSACA